MGRQPRNRIAAVDATTGSLIPWDPDADDYVRGVVETGNTVHIGGQFLHVGGEEWPNLTRLTLARPPAQQVVTSPLGTSPSGNSPVGTSSPGVSPGALGCSPNPVRSLQSGAALRFGLPASGEVTLALFDAAGRRVATVLDHVMMAAGLHDAVARTDALGVGTYFARLEFGAQRVTRKIQVIR